MLQNAARSSLAAANKIKQHVGRLLDLVPWPNCNHQNQRVGLAISGGVDSMALATICSQLSSKRPCTGFIVDHGLRYNSSDEAQAVAEKLERLHGMEAKILKLDWKDHGNPKELTNLETIARRLRYQALGNACVDQQIKVLLVAHHKDDVAETVLSRIVSGYMGLGLAAVREQAKIPHCEGIYGVDASGTSRPLHGGPAEDSDTKHSSITVEGGGLQILRPLLPFTKDELETVCQESGTQWFEDPTNADKTLTLRNAIRYMHRKDLLPTALRRPRMCALAEKTHATSAEIGKQVQVLFDKLRIVLDLRGGSVEITLNENFWAAMPEKFPQSYSVRAALLRMALQLVSPLSIISLQDLDGGVEFVFGTPFPGDGRKMPLGHTIAGVYLERKEPVEDTKETTVFMYRQRPLRAQLQEVIKLGRIGNPDSSIAHFRWSEWQLWDGRYWIRLGHFEGLGQGQTAREGSEARHALQFLSHELIKTIETDDRARLRAALKSIPERARMTVPAVTRVDEHGNQTLCALPTLEWSNTMLGYRGRHDLATADGARPEWVHEARYKCVDLKQTESHTMLSR